MFTLTPTRAQSNPDALTLALDALGATGETALVATLSLGPLSFAIMLDPKFFELVPCYSDAVEFTAALTGAITGAADALAEGLEADPLDLLLDHIRAVGRLELPDLESF